MTTSRDIILASIASHNTRAERTSRELEPWARVAVATAIAALGAAALVMFATPCDTGHQCAGLLLAPAAHMRSALRGSWLHRVWAWPRAAYLRTIIRWAQEEVDDMESILRNEVRTWQEQRHIQAQIRSHQLWIAERQIMLIDIDLATRRG